jgi:hypothetical protein
VDGELLAGENPVLRVGGEFDPERDRGCVVAAAFGEKCKLSPGSRSEFGGDAEFERLRTSDFSAVGLAATLEEA